jgi:hypothetical protein
MTASDRIWEAGEVLVCVDTTRADISLNKGAHYIVAEKSYPETGLVSLRGLRGRYGRCRFSPLLESPAGSAASGAEPTLPDNNPKTAFGMQKPGMECVPFAPLFEIGEAMRFGANKYGAFNWRDANITASVYYNAMMRHLAAWFHEHEDNAPDSGVHHLAHIAANFVILRDAEKHGVLNDDRPKARAG